MYLFHLFVLQETIKNNGDDKVYESKNRNQQRN